MQTVNVIFKHKQNVTEISGGSSSKNTGLGGWITRLFGCRHREMSRPFSLHGQTYRSCVDCGARRQFNVGQWKMQGDFYYRQPSVNQLSAA
jgi:hypothetical protein